MDEPAPPWRSPPVWRALLWLARFLCVGVCRLRVTGDVPAGRRQGPLLLAANHIGAFDPVVLAAACARIGVAPRIMATGGLFRAPLFGTLMRRSGHVRVDRREAHVVDALETGRAALAERAVLLAYPEGRITLDPAMWPERGKTGLARLAMETGTPVVPVAQWGAHLVLPWGAPRGSLRRIGWSVLHRPVVRVHFGSPVDLADLSPTLPTTELGAATTGAAAGPASGAATTVGGNAIVRLRATGNGRLAVGVASAKAVRVATDRIIEALAVELESLRPGEPRLPAWLDPARPVSTARSFRRPPPSRVTVGAPGRLGEPGTEG